MRDAFRAIVVGWTPRGGIGDIAGRICAARIERAVEWAMAHGPLQPDERAAIELMIRCQVARPTDGTEPSLDYEWPW